MIVCQQAIVDVGGSASSGGGGGSRCTMMAMAASRIASPSSFLASSSATAAAQKQVDQKMSMSSSSSSPGKDKKELALAAGLSNLSLAMMNQDDAENKEGWGSNNSSPRSSMQNMQMMENENDVQLEGAANNQECTQHDDDDMGREKCYQEQEEAEEDLITIVPRSDSWTARAAFHEPSHLPQKQMIHDTSEQEVEWLQEENRHDGFVLLDTLQKSPFTDENDADDGSGDKEKMFSWNNNDKLSNAFLWDSNEKKVVVSEIHEMCAANNQRGLRLRMFEEESRRADKADEEEWVVTSDAAAQDELAKFRSFLEGALQ